MLIRATTCCPAAGSIPACRANTRSTGAGEREAYIRSLTENPGRVYGEVYTADDAGIRTLAGRRLAYTGLRRPEVEGLLRETGDSAARENYRIRKAYAADRLGGPERPRYGGGAARYAPRRGGAAQL